MKIKHKSERVLERITRLADSIDWLGVGLIVILLFAVLGVVAQFMGIESSYERYQAIFDDCIAAATLTTEQCHDIALAVIQ